MPMSNEEHFHDIAHQVFAGTAPPADVETLREMLATDPDLRQEYSAIAAGSMMARELAPLMETPPIPPGRIPPPPVQRLREEVSQAFTGRQRAKNELGQLMEELGIRIRGLMAEERELAEAALRLLRRSFSAARPAAGSSERLGMVDRSRGAEFGLTDLYESFPPRDVPRERHRSLSELRLRLVELNDQLTAAEQNTHHLREQIREILAALETTRK